MSVDMEVDSMENTAAASCTRIALHPLTIVHMSDQFTRITCGGSPLARDAPVVGLLFGGVDEDSNVLQIHDADDIPTELSDATKVQVELHRAVFPQHTVVGWYRVSGEGEEPMPSDLTISQQLKEYYAPSTSAFCFCLLHVADPDKKPISMNVGSGDAPSTMQDNLPINLYELRILDGKNSILLGLSNWHLETSDPERIAVERVMKEPSSSGVVAGQTSNIYTTQMKSVQHSLLSMKERIQLLVNFLEQTQEGKIPPNYNLLRQVQGLLYSLGPISSSVVGKSTDQEIMIPSMDARLLSHLVVVAKTVRAVESYTDVFRVLHESENVNKEMRRVF